MSAPLFAVPQSSFTDQLWVSIEPIYAAILRHPFIAGLTDGSLPRELFEFYAVGAVLEATNEVAAQLGDVERAAMHRHFRTTSRYEWMFWDMGYRCEQWPFEDEVAEAKGDKQSAKEMAVYARRIEKNAGPSEDY